MSLPTPKPIPDRRVRVTFEANTPTGVDAVEYREFFAKLMAFYYPSHRLVITSVETLSEVVPTPAQQKAACDASLAALKRDIATLGAAGALSVHRTPAPAEEDLS